MPWTTTNPGLVVVLTAAGFVLLKPFIRRLSLPLLRRFTASAGDYVI
jgi:hypothetical protein